MALACDIALEELDLSLWTYAGAKNAGIDTVADLVALPPAELARLLGSTPKALAELRQALQLHARRVLDVAEQYQQVSTLPISWLEPPCEVRARLNERGVNTLGGLIDAPVDRRTDVIYKANTDALVLRFYAYCAVRGRDDQGGPTPSWLDETDSVDPLLAAYQRDVRTLESLNRADEVLVSGIMHRGHRGHDPSPSAERLAATPKNISSLHERPREALVEAAAAWVVEWATGYADSEVDLMDLIQQGNLGLMRALDGYDYKQGQRFRMPAWWWARQLMDRYLDDHRYAVRVPAHVAEALRRYTGACEQLWDELGREPTVEQLCVRLQILSAGDSCTLQRARRSGVPIGPALEHRLRSASAKVRRIAALAQEPLRLHETVGDAVAKPHGYLIEMLDTAGLSVQEARDDCIGDLVACDYADEPIDAMTREQLRATLDEALRTLTPRQRMVTELRFGLTDGQERTLGEIGLMLGVTRERIRQIEARALRKLRHPRVRRRLAGFLL